MATNRDGSGIRDGDGRGPAQPARQEGLPVSRRTVLGAAGGLAGALGTGLLSGRARAQGTVEMAATGRNGHGAIGYSNRAYNITVPEVAAGEIARDPTDLPPPISRRTPATVRVDLETTEVEAAVDIEAGATFQFWTFNNRVPGPFVRVRVGDTVEVVLKNHPDSTMLHNVDFHAVTGPGGGAEATTAAPGETRAFRFKALNPGLYVYHCATPPVVMHIANGMYGLILVEPEEGLPPVDREFYVMQGEIYSEQPFGSSGLLDASYEKMLNETPEYYVFNGSVGALSTRHPMKARVDETVRFFFGVGGPNRTSSLHMIGEIFDRVYDLGALPREPLRNVGTLTVPAGGATIAELKLDYPGRYVLVDHAISRVERGLAGWLEVEGPDNPDVFAVLGTPPPG